MKGTILLCQCPHPSNKHCVSAHIRCYSGPHFFAFGLNTERSEVSLRIQSNCGEIRYSFEMRENTDQNNSEHGHFLHNEKLPLYTKIHPPDPEEVFIIRHFFLN